MAVLIGLDCGGSSTRALCASGDGSIVGRGRSGPGNWASTPHDLIERSIREASEGMPSPDAAAVCFAGLLTDHDRAQAELLLSRIFPSAKVSAHPDTEAVLAADPGADAGVISGTGCTIFSMRDGRIWRSAGGGPLFGDHGSVFDVVRRAIDAIALRPDRMEASDDFWDAAERICTVRDPDRLVAALYRAPSPPRLACRLGPVVIADALAGKAYASEALKGALWALAKGIRGHLRHGHPELRQPNVVLAGGLWRIEPRLADELQELLTTLSQAEGPPFPHVRILEAEPVEGALALARKSALLLEIS
jgi:glucosamine kinase